MRATPELWRVLVKDLALDASLSWSLWTALHRARWSLAGAWREAFLAFARRAAPGRREVPPSPRLPCRCPPKASKPRQPGARRSHRRRAGDGAPYPTSSSSSASSASCSSSSVVGQGLVALAELNRPDVTGAEAAPPQLVRAGTEGIVPRIHRLARRQQGEMPVARSAVIREGAEARVARQVAGLQGDGAAGRVADQVVGQRGDRTRHNRGYRGHSGWCSVRGWCSPRAPCRSSLLRASASQRWAETG